jgi:ABC-type glycerol-3-phosphate transport system permease component
MKLKKFRVRIRFKPATILLYACMLGLVAFTALPLIYMVSTAFKPLDELFLYPPRYLVRKPTMKSFFDLLTAVSGTVVPFTRYIFNSLLTTVVIVFFSVLFSCMGGFALVKYKPAGSNIIFAVILAALMFSNHVVAIPTYMVVNYLGIVNTYWALIIPKLAGAYSFFLIKQFSEQIPDAFLEAARIDGAGEFRIFWQVVMPLLKPAWSTLVVFSFVSNWNDYFTPLIYTTSQAMKTLPLALSTISGGSIARAGASSASALLTTLPTIILFTIMQGRVMQTMTHSGIKA